MLGARSSQAAKSEIKDEWQPRLRYSAELISLVRQVTLNELHWQEANFEHDAALGRELLFLIANNDWIRASTELLDIERSDSVQTTIKVEVDLDRITHEAFRDQREGSLWLPLLLLPPLRTTLEPDPLATLKVTAADGTQLATLPGADVHRRLGRHSPISS